MALLMASLSQNNLALKLVLENLLSDYSTCCTNCVFTRSVHQPRVYAFGVLTTRLCV